MADTTNLLAELRRLPIDERIRIVEDLWDIIAEGFQGKDFPVSPELAEELDRRLAEYRANPDSGVPWEVVRDRLRRRIGDKPE